MIQSAQLIFDDFIYVYETLTRLMITLLSTTCRGRMSSSLAAPTDLGSPSPLLFSHIERCQPVSPGSRDDLKLLLSRFASVQASLEAFLAIFRRVEHLTDRRAPELIPLPR